MRWISMLALLAPMSAFAAPSVKVLAGGPKQVEISGTVEVPLLRGPLTDSLPAVWGVLPPAEKAKEGTPPTGVLVVLDLAEGWSTISPGLAKTLGLKTSKGKGFFKGMEFAVVPQLTVGTLVLGDIPVVVGPVSGGRAEMVLGLGTLEGVASAILPSQGTAKFVPSKESDALLAAVGDAAVAQRERPVAYWEHGEKRLQSGVGLAIPGEVLGVAGLVVPATRYFGVALDGERHSSWAYREDGVGREYGTVRVLDATLPSVSVRQLDALDEETGKVIAGVGYSALYAADLAVDPATGRISVRVATAVKAADPATLFAEEALGQYAFSTKPSESKEEAPKPAEGPDKGDEKKVKAESKLASALSAAGRFDEALEHRAAAAASAGDNCLPYYKYGEELVWAGRASEAVVPLKRAAELWDRWMSQDLNTRLKISAGKKSKHATFELEQPYGCQDAWGQLAAAHLALAEFDQVAAIHKEHSDLDQMLELASGVSFAAKGQFEQANGPLRQALKLDAPSESHEDTIRLALAWSQASLNPTVASAQLAEVTPGRQDAVDTVAATEIVRSTTGDARALDAVSAAQRANPGAVGTRLIAALEAKRQGTLKPEELTAVKAMLAQEELALPFEPVTPTYHALVQLLDGDAAGAKVALEKAKSTSDRQPIYYLALAFVERELQNPAGVDAALLQLRHRFPHRPTGWLDLTPEPVAPETPPVPEHTP